MPFELFRIDERLIHGQVIVGWGNRLGLQFYVIVDEVLAASDWEQEIWASALGREATAEFLPALETARRFAELEARPGRGALLTRDTATMRALAEYGCLDGRAVNVGGLQDGPGRRKILDYLHLSHDEFEDLKAIGRHGVVSARDVPTARAVPLRDLEPR